MTEQGRGVKVVERPELRLAYAEAAVEFGWSRNVLGMHIEVKRIERQGKATPDGVERCRLFRALANVQPRSTRMAPLGRQQQDKVPHSGPFVFLPVSILDYSR